MTEFPLDVLLTYETWKQTFNNVFPEGSTFRFHPSTGFWEVTVPSRVEPYTGYAVTEDLAYASAIGQFLCPPRVGSVAGTTASRKTIEFSPEEDIPEDLEPYKVWKEIKT
jgi:hypothetical protein